VSAAHDLRSRDFPALVAGKCVLVPERPGGLRMLPGRAVRPDQYALSISGALGDRWMSFVAVEDEAVINLILKRGWRGGRFRPVPTAALIDALRELGFKTMVLPSGERYEIREKRRGIRRLI
jgi:hypothetical protein